MMNQNPIKRIFALMLAMLCMLCLFGCKSDDYKKAKKLLETGFFEEARDMFVQLEGYRDSAEQITECNYRIALKTLEAGSYDLAKTQFAALNGYKDSAEKLRICTFEIGKAQIAGGKYAEGIQTLSEIADYEGVETLIREAKWNVLFEYVKQNGKLDEDGDYTVTLPDVTDSARKILLTMGSPDKVILSYSAESSDTNLTMVLLTSATVYRDDPNGIYADFSCLVLYNAYSTEIATGKADWSTFTENTVLTHTEYSSETRDIYGITKKSTNVSDAILVTSDSTAKQLTAMLKALPATVLDKLDAPVTLRDLGFLAFEGN